MGFWEDFCALAEKTDIWDSNAEEHNRYTQPPKGVEPSHWAHMIFKLKYEFRQLRPNKEEESDE